MFAVNQISPGGPETLRLGEAETPHVKGDQVLIKVAAAGINRADLMQREGKYPPPKDASPILGMEVAGEIVACGPEVKERRLGERVCALLSGGGYAEFACVSERMCLSIPEGLSVTEAAALPEGAITVWANVFVAGHLGANETILIHGGSSGIGTLAIQMAKKHGSTVIVTAKTDEKGAACRRLGADLAVTYEKTDFVDAVLSMTANEGCDVILDMVGGDYIPRNLRALRTEGRHVSIATQKGSVTTIDLRLVMAKRLTLTGSTMRARTLDQKAELMGGLKRNMWDFMGASGIKPLIYQTYPIKEVGAAHKMMESGAHIGKIMLEIVP